LVGVTKREGAIDVDVVAVKAAAKIDKDQIAAFDVPVLWRAVMGACARARSDHAADAWIPAASLHHACHDDAFQLGLHDAFGNGVACRFHGVIGNLGGAAHHGDFGG
jgi:hypothetical protein